MLFFSVSAMVLGVFQIITTDASIHNFIVLQSCPNVNPTIIFMMMMMMSKSFK